MAPWIGPGFKEVRARIGAVKACYERALKRNPSLSARSRYGGPLPQPAPVSGVDIADDSMGDSEVSSCIKQLVPGWRFPAPSAGSAKLNFRSCSQHLNDEPWLRNV